jgi:hypothetical protein
MRSSGVLVRCLSTCNLPTRSPILLQSQTPAVAIVPIPRHDAGSMLAMGWRSSASDCFNMA